jgi:hypothetical protein
MFKITRPFVKGTSLFNSFPVIVVAVIISSCAGSYKPIVPSRLSYGSVSESNGMSYAYRHNILTESGNKKYAKREAKGSLKLMAIEITNTTDRTINFNRDIKMYMGDRQVLPVEPSIVYQQLRQRSGLYMLWSLFWVVFTKCDDDGNCSSTPLPVGLVIGIGNTAAASGANQKFMDELNATDLLTKEIKPGETVKGLIGISSTTSGSISLKLD